MEKYDAQEPVKNTGKTSKANNIATAIRPIIPKSKKGVYPFYDAISSEVVTKHGREDLCRAIFSSIFFTGTSKVAAEKASRRKFRCNPSQNLDLSKFDHIASMFFETVVDRVTTMPQSSFRLLCIEYIPEMLAAINPEERDLAYRRAAMLIYGRETRKKEVEEDKVVPVEEIAKTEITEVKEIGVPTTVSINESGLELEIIPESVTATGPEITSDIILSPEDPIVNTLVLPENIPEPITDPIMASYAESQITYQQEVDSSGIVDNNTNY